MPRLWLILFFVVACAKPQLAAICEDAEDCGGFVCQAFGASAQGQCTLNCQDDDQQCVDAYGEGTCFVTCVLECSKDSDCPPSTGCYQGLCEATCSDDSECKHGNECYNRYCETASTSGA